MDHIIAIDTETTGLEWDDTLFGISWATNEGSWYVDVRDEEAKVYLAALTILFHWTSCEYVFHNMKFDLHKLVKFGIINYEWVKANEHRLHDTQVLHNLYDSYADSYKLKDSAKELLGVDTDEAKVLNAWFKANKMKKEVGYQVLPRDILEPYAIKDAEYTRDLFRYFKPKFSDQQWEFYRDKITFGVAIMDAELQGMKADMEFAKKEIRRLSAEADHSLHAVKCIAGEEFNPQSPKQVIEYLQGEGHLISDTKFDTLVEVDSQLAQEIINIRKSLKLRDTYFRSLQEINHSNFKLHTRTGRTSSGNEE